MCCVSIYIHLIQLRTYEMATTFVNNKKVSTLDYRFPVALHKVIIRQLKPWDGMTLEETKYLDELSVFKKVDQLEFDAKTYLYYLELMLWVEEIECLKNLRRYDLKKQKILRIDENYFQIYVRNQLEGRPTILVNDLINIINVKTHFACCAKVKEVMDDHIIVEGNISLCSNYNENHRYDVKFRLNNFPFWCQHFALSQMHNLRSYIFPTSTEIIRNPNMSLHWFNEKIANNPEQKQCILNILNKTSLGAPYILYGPPGTGKTATVVEAVCQAMMCTDKRILVCTPSNAAADVITIRLLKYVEKKYLHRMYSRSTVVSTIDENILECSNCIDGAIVMLPLKSMPKIIISTLCTSIRLKLSDSKINDFSYIFIDEAGQATESETMIPFSLLTSHHQQNKLHGQIVLAGDPKQLGPVIRSGLAETMLGKSMLERMMNYSPYESNGNDEYNSNYVTKLLINYRNHPAIIHISNRLFYHDALKYNNDEKNKIWHGLVNKQFPIIFHGIRGVHATSENSQSFYNMNEVHLVMDYLRRLVGSNFGNSICKPSDIGIITPYTTQKLILQHMLGNSVFKDVEVGTIQTFQGKEKEIIILSTVKGDDMISPRYKVGFLSDPKRFNVAVSRAKSLMIVIGHPNVHAIDPNCNYLLKYCIENKAYIGANYYERPNQFASKQPQPVPKVSLKIIIDDEIRKMNTSTNTDVICDNEDPPETSSKSKNNETNVPVNDENNLDDCNCKKKGLYSNNLRLQSNYPNEIDKKVAGLNDQFNNLNMYASTSSLVSRKSNSEKSKKSKKCTIL